LPIIDRAQKPSAVCPLPANPLDLAFLESPTHLTASDDPTRKMMRQIAGAFAEYEKARLVHKLRHARERYRKEHGKCEGRKPHAELRPEVVAEAKRLRRASLKTGERLSYRKISNQLAAAGFVNELGKPFNPKSIKAMLDQPNARSKK
jgi:DNA invertase Pin-like site-specific DNA recombinase